MSIQSPKAYAKSRITSHLAINTCWPSKTHVEKKLTSIKESGSSGAVNRLEQPLSVSTIATIRGMATAKLINPALSRSGGSSDSSPTAPDSSRQPKRRTALLRQQLSLDIPDGSRALLSSSLPSPISKKELSFLKAIHQNEKNKRQKFKESKESLSKSMEVPEPSGRLWLL